MSVKINFKKINLVLIGLIGIGMIGLLFRVVKQKDEFVVVDILLTRSRTISESVGKGSVSSEPPGWLVD
ncbi:hypothetical protein DRH14_02205 [Candidatus Shapirobacteria bacterium]|nr:MAG: hypothetical protein DRH14_02205 [Candidatus Shapirobacteria bacterium]